MKKMAAIVLLAVVTIGFSTEALAGKRDPRVNTRQAYQQAKIRQGVKSGELTKKEAVKLEANQRRIARTEHRMKSDGNMTAAERAKLDTMQDKQREVIYKQKHDDQDRP